MELFKVDYYSSDEEGKTFRVAEIGIFSSMAITLYEINAFTEDNPNIKDGDTMTVTSFILDEIGSDVMIHETTIEVTPEFY